MRKIILNTEEQLHQIEPAKTEKNEQKSNRYYIKELTFSRTNKSLLTRFIACLFMENAYFLSNKQTELTLFSLSDSYIIDGNWLKYDFLSHKQYYIESKLIDGKKHVIQIKTDKTIIYSINKNMYFVSLFITAIIWFLLLILLFKGYAMIF